MPASFRFRCPNCSARIRAPLQLGGHARHCPGCRASFVVPRLQLEDAGPRLVLLEGRDSFRIHATR